MTNKNWFKNLFMRKNSVTPPPSKRNFINDFIPYPNKNKKVEVYKMIRKTPCGFHAWYASNVGEIRKPIQP